jgi:ankyrin repeat protein
MKHLRPLCIIVITVLLVCSCESKKDLASEQPKANTPTVTETNSPQKTVTPSEQPTQPQAKKIKAALQAFFDAALKGDIQTVSSELADGVDVNATNPNSQTALMLAAFNGHTKLVEMLINHGGNVNHLDTTNRTALMYCSSGPFPETVQLLIDKGAKVNIIDNNEKWTALMFAAAEGQANNVKLLLEHNADWKLKDIDGDTAASFATKNGHKQVADMINAHK